MKPYVLFLVGPTASGKSSLAVKLAKIFKGEIISADSMQVYRGMNVGTAKPNLKERSGIKHHLMDLISVRRKFSVYEFRNHALQKIQEIVKRGKLPMIVGGTGLYVRSLLQGLDELPAANEAFRKKLTQDIQKKGIKFYYQKLKKLDPQRAKQIKPTDERRIVRALEILQCQVSSPRNKMSFPRKRESIGRTMDPRFRGDDNKTIKSLQELGYQPIVIGITKPREILYSDIEVRVNHMIKRGLMAEVKRVASKGMSQTAAQAVGYKEILQYLKGNTSKDEAIQLVKRNTRRLAKRQMTWFRKEKGIDWFERGTGENENDFLERLKNKIQEAFHLNGA